MKKLSVVVTGTGIATAIGLSEPESLNALTTGQSGIRALENYEYRGKGLPVGLCDIGRVKSYLEEKGFELPDDEQRGILLALYVAHRALADAAPLKTGEKRGLYVGSSLTANDALAHGYRLIFSGRRNTASSIVECSNCYCTARISKAFGLYDACTTVSSSCASGLQCLGFAMRDLELGIVNEAVVIGVDSSLDKDFIDTWMSARVLSRIEPFDKAARPFCNTRRGFVYGEGAGCVVLRKTADNPLLEVTAVHSTSGSQNFFAVTEEHMVRCMEGALAQAGVLPSAVDFVHASANGSRQGDLEEARALTRVFGKSTPVYSSKALYGNTHGAQGICNLIHAMLIMQEGRLPSNPHIFEEDPEIAGLINCGYETGSHPELKTGLLNTFGFCGMNASVVFKKIDNRR